ncbi:MAG: hypothetical protein ACREL4_07320 [Gemmatimonadales bacterium]
MILMMRALALSLLIAATAPQRPLLQFGGFYPGVPWKGIKPYIAQNAPRPAACHLTADVGANSRTRTCVARRLLLTNDIRANVTFTVDDSSGKVVSIIAAWRPVHDQDREVLVDSLTATHGAPNAADSGRAAAEWTQGPVALKVTARPMPGTTESGVTNPIVVMLINTPLQHAVDGRLKTAAPPAP